MIRFFANHPTAANVLMVAIIIMGLTALPKLQRDTFPVIPATEVEIRTSYPGATPAEVEDAVCLRIEDALDSVQGLREVRCDARENIAIVTAKMYEGTDLNTFFNDVKSQVEAITSFPDKVEKSSIIKLERTANVASIAITGKVTPQGLKAYAESVKSRLKQDKRIAQVRIQGFSDQILLIELSAGSLQRYGMTLSDIRMIIERQSLDMPAGTLQTPSGDIIVRFTGQRRTTEELGNLVVITSKNGARVRLGEIATINSVFEHEEDKVLFNGQRAAFLEISKTYDQDSLNVMEAIKENLKHESAIAPKGIELAISTDVTSNIRDRLRILISNSIQGLVLVFLTMWLFFSLRFSFWVTMGLPVSILGAIYGMHTLGYTLNMMTLVGLLVAIGLLMDDAIVISENIAAQLNKGKKSLEAAVDGVRQVMPGVLSSFFTTAMIVGPLAFLSGKMGDVLKYIPAVLLITLLVSLVEAFFILPAHLNHAMNNLHNERRSRFQLIFQQGFEWVRDVIFLPVVKKATRKPRLAISVMMLLVLISIATMPAGILKYQAFPDLESDVIQARITLPQGTPLLQTEEVVSLLVSSLHVLDEEFTPRQPEGQSLVNNISVLFNTNVDAHESGPHIATVSADLLRAGTRDATVEELLNRWRTLVGEVPGVINLKFTDKERGVAGKAVDLRIQGHDLKTLKAASVEIQKFLSTIHGVEDISDDLRPGKPEFRVHLKESAGVFGITARTVADELRMAIYGNTNLEVLRGYESYDVTVRLAENNRDSLDDLLALRLRAPDGTLVPLSTVADIEQRRDYARIHRVNGQKTVTIQASLDTAKANAREVMGLLSKQFLPTLKERYPDVHFASQGQDMETRETGNSLQTNLLIGLIGVYLILLLQFRSYIQPLAVMLAIPMGFIGVVWGHLLMGIDLTMPSLVGFATLAGIVVNDNILLVTFIKKRLREGENVKEAGWLAAKDRFRPIMITSLTTLAGLLPLLTETSTQAQILIPLVASLAFGLLTATTASLFFVPAFFAFLDENRK
ncbi:MAG: efflux RND transporter permease subunit [Candidatus Endonucleobacter sp. (ex Gigantidas childressi)]|nr:efflux RND transporter permease subunit [Candidatus Endonucleobacter sp. (ex Gigantidas childressi)]